jgi:hypothetical protein
MNGESLHGHTMPLHSVQLYEAVGCLLILIAVWAMRKRWRQPGSSFFFLLVLYLPLRIAAEFFRASDLPMWYGVKLAQVVMLVFWIAAVSLLRRNERVSFFRQTIASGNPFLLVGFFLCELALFLSTTGYLHFIEKVVIAMALAGTAALMGKEVRNWSTVVLHRAFLLPASVGIILIYTAQVSQEKSRHLQDTISYNSVHLGFATGDYVNTLRDADGCGANTRDYNQEYVMVGAGFSRYKRKGKQSTEVGVSVFGGSQSETPMTVANHDKTDYPTFGLHGYAKFDGGWAGIGGGLNIGNLRYAEDRRVQPLLLSSPGHFETPIMPSLYARIGPKRIFYVQYDLANSFPASTPGYMHQLSIGSGFGARSGFAVNLGTPVTHLGTFLNVTVPIKNITINSTYTWGLTQVEYPQGDYPIRQLRFSLSYHLDRKY